MHRPEIMICSLVLLGVGLVHAASAALTVAQLGTPTLAGQTLHFDVQFHDTFLAADIKMGGTS